MNEKIIPKYWLHRIAKMYGCKLYFSYWALDFAMGLYLVSPINGPIIILEERLLPYERLPTLIHEIAHHESLKLQSNCPAHGKAFVEAANELGWKFGMPKCTLNNARRWPT